MKKKLRTQAAAYIVSACALAVFMTAGCSDKIDPDAAGGRQGRIAEPEHIVKAELRTITESYEAVGTVRPRTEMSIESQITAQVMKVGVVPGSRVRQGDLLVSLDDRQMKSRLDQAREALKSSEAGKSAAVQAVAAAKAAFAQAEASYRRVKSYFDSQAATSQELERAESAWLQAKAGLQSAQEAVAGAESGVRRAREVVKEAEIGVGYTRITAPADGEVLKKLVEPGDLALPGKPMAILQTSGFLRLEAYVREGLIEKAGKGSRITVVIETLDKTADAVIEEIVPYADPRTRTFLVKAALPRMEGLYPGMYGKLLIPVRETEVVLVPASAVRKVGQLEFALVNTGDGWEERYIKTGKRFGEDIEVLSGLTGKEDVGF